MADANKEGRHDYRVKPGEPVGFVFPVYFYSLPTVVNDFLDRLKLAGAGYIYAVITCGDIINDTEDGYPFEEVIRRLNSFAVTTYRTDADGTIVFQTEGKKWQGQKRP